MMKLFIVAAAVLLLSTTVEAQTVCVILNAGATAVLGPAVCDPTSNPPSTTIDASDARYTNWLALRNISATANNLLQAGVTMTFTKAASANDAYPADAAGVQALLNIYTSDQSIKGKATVSVQGSTGPHPINAKQFTDLYDAVTAYNAAVLAAQAAAIATNTAPVWPAATATSTN